MITIHPDLAARMLVSARDPATHAWALRVWAKAGEPAGLLPRAEAILTACVQAWTAFEHPYTTEEERLYAFGCCAMAIGVPAYTVEKVWSERAPTCFDPPPERDPLFPSSDFEMLADAAALAARGWLLSAQGFEERRATGNQSRCPFCQKLKPAALAPACCDGWADLRTLVAS